MITTDFGSWSNHSGGYNVSVEGDLADFVNGGDAEWRHHLVTCGTFSALARAFRDAVNAALPDSVALCGNSFYGPYYSADLHVDGYPTDDLGRLDIEAIIDGIDLTAVLDVLDPDADYGHTVTVTTCGATLVKVAANHAIDIDVASGAVTLAVCETPVVESEVHASAPPHVTADRHLTRHGWVRTGAWQASGSELHAPTERM